MPSSYRNSLENITDQDAGNKQINAKDDLSKPEKEKLNLINKMKDTGQKNERLGRNAKIDSQKIGLQQTELKHVKIGANRDDISGLLLEPPSRGSLWRSVESVVF